MSEELLLIFILGAVVGSFLNVIIFRYNTGRGLGGRSHCLSCGKTLTPVELIPIVSFFIQHGKCKACGTKISPQYALVEFFTGLLFVGIFFHYQTYGMSSPELFVIDVFIWSILVVIFVYDLRHKIIPDGMVFAFIALSILKVIIHSNGNFLEAGTLFSFFAGPILALPFFFLWLFSKGRWIGFGDGKLALGIGWFLGITPAVSAVLIGVWVGAAISIFILIIQKFSKNKGTSFISKFVPGKITAKTEIPFAPFLIIGTAAVYFLSLSVLTF